LQWQHRISSFCVRNIDTGHGGLKRRDRVARRDHADGKRACADTAYRSRMAYGTPIQPGECNGARRHTTCPGRCSRSRS
jgi:hypothetical protein